MGSIVDVMINSFNGMSPVEQMDNDDDEMMKTNMNMQKSEKKSEKAKTCSRRSLPGCRGGPKAETSQHELSPWFLQFNMFNMFSLFQLDKTLKLAVLHSQCGSL